MKILIVDDEETNCKVLRKLLTNDMHEVIIAGNGKEGVDLFEKFCPDLVLMDVMMPVMDGYEAAGLIKQKSISEFVPIIFLTALENDDALVRCLESGGDDFLSKPFNMSVLRAKISAMTRIRQLQSTIKDQNKELLKFQAKNAREMLIAEDIFNKVVNCEESDSEIIRIYHKPAENFNGDIAIALKSPRGHFNVMIGDFTGHGLASAMCTLPVIEIFKKMTAKGYGIDSIIKQVSIKIREYLPADRFFASCFISINPKENSFSIWNGGMPDVYVFNNKQGIYRTISSDKLPLGILSPENTDVSLYTFDVKQGDRIFAYSDGLIELQIKDNVMFGDDRLKKLINDNRSAESINEVTEKEISPLIQKVCLKDDVTFLEIFCDLNKLCMIKTENQTPSDFGNWDVTFDLDVETIKMMDPLPVMLSVLEEMQEFISSKELVSTILSEMYSNALEHGLLSLESQLKEMPGGLNSYNELKQTKLNNLQHGSISVKFSHRKSQSGATLTISVQDSGSGFDVNYVNSSSYVDSHKSGRGIMLMKHLCKEFWFNETGNQSNAVLDWNKV